MSAGETRTRKVVFQGETEVEAKTVSVAEWNDVPETPGEGLAVVKVLVVPINPADLNVIEGTYGRLEDPPRVLGHEGVGEIEALGDGTDGLGLEVGSRVIWVGGNFGGCWATHIVVPAECLVVIPSDLDAFQAAQLTVNPATAYQMLKMVPLEEGDWVVQNASNSAVGLCVAAICKEWGINSINVVRRPEVVEGVERMGATAVVLEEDEAFKRWEEIGGGASKDRVKLALNAVGGKSASDLSKYLGVGATHVTYGAMSRERFAPSASSLIFRDICYRGYWLNSYFKRSTRDERQAVYHDLAAMVASGKVFLPIDSAFAIDDVAGALARAAQGKRSGKVFIDMRLGTPDADAND